jgi:hypothetical protein
LSAIERKLNLRMPGLTQTVPILAILMEVFWFYAWLVWLSSITALGWPNPPLNLWSCLAQAVFSEVLNRYALARKWSLKKVRLLVLPGSLALLLLLIRLNLGGGYTLWDGGWGGYISGHPGQLIIGLLAGVYLTWRGLSVGTQNSTFRNIYNRFLVGLAAIVILLVLWGVTKGELSRIGSSPVAFTVLFFGTGLLGMATANLEALRVELMQHQEASVSFNRRWISMLVALVLVILAVGIAVASIFSTDLATTLLHYLGVIGDWLLTAFVYLLYPVAFVATGLYYVFRWLLSLITHGPPPDQQQLQGVQDLKDIFKEQGNVPIPEGVILALKWGSILLAAAAVIYFLTRIIMRYTQSKTTEDIDEVHETLGSWKLLSADLRALLAWLFRWAHRPKRASSESAGANYTPVEIDEDSGRVYTARELYRAWLWQASQRWSPRRLSETPYEYRQRLNQSGDAANLDEEVKELTESYVSERYGQEKTGAEALKKLNQVWRTLRSKLSHPSPEE